MEKEGSTKVEIIGVDNKRQITAVFVASLTGFFLSPHLIYKGKTHKCLLTISLTGTSHTAKTIGQMKAP